MHDDLDESLRFETLAAALNIGKSQQKDLVETLAKMMTLSLPDNVSITRGGWILSKDKPIEELTIRFDDYHYRIIKEGSGYSARTLKMVRGVALKTTELSLDDCFNEILKELTSLAEQNGKARDALQKFVSGR